MNTIVNELFNRSLQCCDNGNYQSAVALGKELVDIYQSPLGYYTLGLAYALQENWELAKENGLKAYRYVPQATDNLNRLGIAYCSLGEYQKGLKYLEMGADLGDPNCKGNLRYWSNFILQGI
jgi:hypothetical protein